MSPTQKYSGFPGKDFPLSGKKLLPRTTSPPKDEQCACAPQYVVVTLARCRQTPRMSEKGDEQLRARETESWRPKTRKRMMLAMSCSKR